MRNFQLNENDAIKTISSRRPKKQGAGLTQRLIGLGIVKDESQAKMIMIGLIIVGFGIIIYMNIQTFAAPAEVPFDDSALML